MGAQLKGGVLREWCPMMAPHHRRGARKLARNSVLGMGRDAGRCYRKGGRRPGRHLEMVEGVSRSLSSPPPPPRLVCDVAAQQRMEGRSERIGIGGGQGLLGPSGKVGIRVRSVARIRKETRSTAYHQCGIGSERDYAFAVLMLRVRHVKFETCGEWYERSVLSLNVRVLLRSGRLSSSLGLEYLLRRRSTFSAS